MKITYCKDGTMDAKGTYNEIVGRRLRYLREYRKMTQEELARYLGYTSSGTMSLIEAGERGMSKRRIIEAARKLDVHPYVLQTPDEIPHDKLILVSEIIKIVLDPTKEQTTEAISAIVSAVKSKT